MSVGPVGQMVYNATIGEARMDQPSRRHVLRTLAVGAAIAASSTAAAAPAVARRSIGLEGGVPWPLVAPLRQGSSVSGGWRVQDLSQVRRGASVLTLQHRVHGTAQVHICAHDGHPKGVCSTALVDLIVMDGGHGDRPTNESLGRTLLDLAARILKNEADAADLRPISKMMPHAQRVQKYGPENL